MARKSTPAAVAPAAPPPVEPSSSAAPAPAPVADPVPPKPAGFGKTVRARVIYAMGEYEIDDVIEVPAGVEAPWFDTHPEAVAYAETLKRAA